VWHGARPLRDDLDTPVLAQFRRFRLAALREGAGKREVIADTATVSLELDSRPQSVALVRGMLSSVLELLELGPELRDDVNTAASEACNNVVLHAYGDDFGPLDVGVELGSHDLVVVVRDSGLGIGAPKPSEGRLGVGMAMMSTLATTAEFVDRTTGGTEVRLTFACEAQPHAAFSSSGRRREQVCPELCGDAVVPSCPISFLPAVMGRLATMVAAGARFSLDRLSDLRLLTDAIGAHARASALGERVGFALASAVRRLDVAVGPLRPGSSAPLEQAEWARTPSYLPLLLAEDLRVEALDGYEIVRAVMVDSSPRATARS
jgi:serine/threonine-protein kinase RsbW